MIFTNILLHFRDFMLELGIFCLLSDILDIPHCVGIFFRFTRHKKYNCPVHYPVNKIKETDVTVFVVTHFPDLKSSM